MSTIRSPWNVLARAYAASRNVVIGELDMRECDARAFAQCAEAFAEACDDPHVGISLARWIPRGTYKLVEYAARSAPTLIDSMRVAAEYAPLMNDRLRMRVVETPTELRVEHWIVGEPSSLGRHFDEFAMATAKRFIDEVTGGLATVSRIHFVHTASDHCPDDLFGAPVRYGQDKNAFVIPRAFRDLALPNADPELSHMLCELSERALRETPGWDIVTQTRVAIAVSLNDSHADIASVARAMAVSVRTLERRLHDASTTFEAVRDTYRRDFAVHLLERGEVGRADAARRLRFKSLRGFERAMKRWTRQPGTRVA